MPTDRTLDNIYKSMHLLLDTENIPDFDKVRMLTYFMQRYKAVHKHRPNEPIVVSLRVSTATEQQQLHPQQPVSGFPGDLKDVLHAIPKRLQSRAGNLLSIIQGSRGSLGWNKNRQLLIDTNPIPDSNIVGLVRYVIDSLLSKKMNKPKGWVLFRKRLHELNIPRSLIGSIARWDYSPPSSPKTPPSRKRRRLC